MLNTYRMIDKKLEVLVLFRSYSFFFFLVSFWVGCFGCEREWRKEGRDAIREARSFSFVGVGENIIWGLHLLGSCIQPIILGTNFLPPPAPPSPSPPSSPQTVKIWTKKRQINNPYRGTLSSYGYVLLVIHFLTNVKFPSVLPLVLFFGLSFFFWCSLREGGERRMGEEEGSGGGGRGREEREEDCIC